MAKDKSQLWLTAAQLAKLLNTSASTVNSFRTRKWFKPSFIDESGTTRKFNASKVVPIYLSNPETISRYTGVEMLEASKVQLDDDDLPDIDTSEAMLKFYRASREQIRVQKDLAELVPRPIVLDLFRTACVTAKKAFERLPLQVIEAGALINNENALEKFLSERIVDILTELANELSEPRLDETVEPVKMKKDDDGGDTNGNQ